MSTLIDVAQLRDELGVAGPYLMLDRARIAADARTGEGVKLLSANELFFSGHFPNQPILPGVLQVEAMRQLALLCARRLGIDLGSVPFLAEAARVKFRRPVRPGDAMLVSASVEPREAGAYATARASVGGEVVSQAELLLTPPPAQAQRPAELFVPLREDLAQPGAGACEVEQVKQIIAHRFPFLLIDRVYSCFKDEEGDGRIVALKNVTANEPFFQAAPGATMMPGYAHLEIPAQAGCVYLLGQPENHGMIGLFMSVDRARMHKPVLVGDQLLLDVTITPRGRFGKGRSLAFVGKELVAETDIKFAVVEPDNGKGD